MSNPTQDRILAEAHDPLIARIWRAMAGLRSTVTFMNTGAHPDDETSAMLAALWLRDGVNLSYACSTRGDGGQNDIGVEAGSDLGTLRTAEMERAADVLDMRLYWHGQSAGDSISDFRFSKSGVETMGIWGRERLMQRFVEIIRTDKPDIICPTFLDIPGQHGHHRAMTEAAHDVVALAADASYGGCDLPVWQVSKLYLPAFSGAGGAYDDEVPPPPATVVVAAKGGDPILGMSFERIGQWSRQFHRTQGMGRWVAAGQERDWPLHLAWSDVGEDRGHVSDNLAVELADLGLAEVNRAVEAVIAAFPDVCVIRRKAAQAEAVLAKAEVAPEHMHRITRKRAQLARVIRLASGIDPRARPSMISPDEKVSGAIEALEIDANARSEAAMVAPGQEARVVIESYEVEGIMVDFTLIPDIGQSVTSHGIAVSADATPTDPYPDIHDPLLPRVPALSVTLTADGITTQSRLALEAPVVILPATRARLSDTSAFVNLTQPPRTITLTVEGRSSGTPAFDLPDGWRQDWRGSEVTLHIPGDAPEGLHHLALCIGGAQASSVQVIDHEHIETRVNHRPAVLTVRLAEVALPQARVGYIGAGNDQIAKWLVAAGVDVVEIDDATLAGAEPFAGIDTILVGVFAHRFRPALEPVTQALNEWVKAGGSLVTLYHRPWDNWDPDTTPPARIEIGQPSLRWRVTDAQAEVTLLESDHAALTYPNKISKADWTGWQKERGLYFAKSWDAAYQPLLRMADPEEQPLDGALLVGEFGQGRHTHIALNLHHQLGQLVPGAYRLMANLLTPK